MFIFSTGTLQGARRLAIAPTLTRLLIGAPSAAAQPLANLLDNDPTTVLDLPRTNSTNYTYLEMDYATAQTIGSVRLINKTGNLQVFVSATRVLDGNFAGATAIPLIGGAYPNASNVLYDLPAGATGRYLYLVPSSAATIGYADVRGVTVVFGTLQDISVDIQYQTAELRTSPKVAMYPVANAQYDGTVSIDANFAEFTADTFDILMGVQASLVDGYQVTTGSLTASAPAFVIELVGQTTDFKEIRFTAWQCYAPGVTFEAKRDAFAIPNFKAMVYYSDVTSSPVYRFVAQQ